MPFGSGFSLCVRGNLRFRCTGGVGKERPKGFSRCEPFVQAYSGKGVGSSPVEEGFIGIPKTIRSDRDPRMTSLFWRAFHISLLRPYVGLPPSEPVKDALPEVEETEEILQPEQIVHHQERQLRSGKFVRKYLVKFQNYSPLDAQWMSEEDLQLYPDLLNGYKEAFQLTTTD